MTAMAPPATRTISASQAVAIAEADAVLVCDDMSIYRIEISVDAGRWSVSYRINRPRMAGGGPHYLIDATTGAILDKKYYQ